MSEKDLVQTDGPLATQMSGHLKTEYSGPHGDFLKRRALEHPESPLSRELMMASGWVNRLNVEISTLLSENERLKEAQQWRPIETAPKDQTYILIYNDCESIYVGQWIGDELQWSNGDVCGPDYINPTYWMPLPAPPVDPTKEPR